VDLLIRARGAFTTRSRPQPCRPTDDYWDVISVTQATVLAHRGMLDGRDPARENTLATLRTAAEAGYGLEFDVRCDSAGRLVLTHDPADWSADRDAVALLSDPPGRALHALNVKDPVAVAPTLDVLERAGTMDRFFFFDFELACADGEEAVALAATVAARGALVARRLSDREPVLEDILADAACTHVWLDEFDGRWAGRECVERLAGAGKVVWYVSPELHRPQPLAALRRRWTEMRAWGVAGICTDHPLALSAA
jgi:glycerophosphoryl diester phosphodiesterase